MLGDGSVAPWVNGSQWRRRDLWRWELECGPGYEACQQCALVGCTDSDVCTPDYFNEQYIFGPFFATSPCPSGSYSPDGVRLLQCPASRPYSPPGSSALSDCACGAGTWWDGTSCAACTSTCTLAGTYLPLSACMLRDGSTSDGTCLDCSNYDPSTMNPLTATGFEQSAGPLARAR